MSTHVAHESMGNRPQKSGSESSASSPAPLAELLHGDSKSHWRISLLRALAVPQRFQPSCTHLTMTRVYDSSLKCALCHRPGQ
ncbi:hypothetical protein GGR54DRAFT_292189 [Hypoxylon sp. NC1633]|nr:hypothetical protein GGR54DRAFT_292189 [Hypoxylon sp. NC1633]